MEISPCYLSAFLIISLKEHSDLLSKKYFNFLPNDNLDKSSSYFTESKEHKNTKNTQKNTSIRVYNFLNFLEIWTKKS